MDLEFIGRGTMTIALEAWRKCFTLAQAFAWQPAGTLAPVQLDVPGYVTDWDGNYFECRLQRVTDDDASALARALRSAISMRNFDIELTDRQLAAFQGVSKEVDAYVIEVADFAGIAGFLIAPGWNRHSR